MIYKPYHTNLTVKEHLKFEQTFKESKCHLYSLNYVFMLKGSITKKLSNSWFNTFVGICIKKIASFIWGHATALHASI